MVVTEKQNGADRTPYELANGEEVLLIAPADSPLRQSLSAALRQHDLEIAETEEAPQQIARDIGVVLLEVAAGAWTQEVEAIIASVGAEEAISLVVLSHDLTPELYSDCLELGAEDCLSDDVPPEMLAARVLRELTRVQGLRLDQSHRSVLELYSGVVDRELDAARKMQNQFLPERLTPPFGWEAEVFFRPAKQVSGDFYDSFRMPDGSAVMLLGDVCGKGFDAAFFMALTRSLIRLFVTHDNAKTEDPLDALRCASEYIARQHDELSMFATAFMLVLEPRSGRLRWCNAGQDAGYVRSADGEKREVLEASAPAVGMFPGLGFECRETHLEVGDSVILSTDGISEAFDDKGEAFGNQRMHDALGGASESAADLLRSVSEAVTTHAAGAPQSDDITLMALRRTAC